MGGRRFRFITPVLALGLLLTACGKTIPLTETEKDLFLRADDLVEYGYGFRHAERYETFTKTRNMDGSYQLEYEFETPEWEQENPLYLYVVVTVERRKSDAVMSQKGENIGLGLGLLGSDVEIREIENFGRYGDESRFNLLVRKNQDKLGNYFTMRKDAKIYTVIMSGLYIDDKEIWDELILPKVELISAYDPK